MLPYGETSEQCILALEGWMKANRYLPTTSFNCNLIRAVLKPERRRTLVILKNIDCSAFGKIKQSSLNYFFVFKLLALVFS